RQGRGACIRHAGVKRVDGTSATLLAFRGGAMLYVLIVLAVLVALLALVAIHDVFIQKSHTLLHNFPIIARFRYLMEELGPPLRQYIVSRDNDERPYDRTTRSWVYQSSKGVNNVIGFGSQLDHNAPGKMHILPSMFATLESE